MNNKHEFKNLDFDYRSASDLVTRSEHFLNNIRKRRTVRDFSPRPVPESVITNAIQAAGSAPSGANMQPWHFVVISNSGLKAKIRQAAEIEERELYEHRASEEWLNALAPLGTDANKPFLETAPYLIAIFAKKYSIDSDGKKHKHYYTPESVGIATGFLIAALHHAGLATLTHTPSPMGFLRTILDRPDHEKPFLLLVTGYPDENTRVPNISKKPVDEITSWKT